MSGNVQTISWVVPPSRPGRWCNAIFRRTQLTPTMGRKAACCVTLLTSLVSRWKRKIRIFRHCSSFASSTSMSSILLFVNPLLHVHHPASLRYDRLSCVNHRLVDTADTACDFMEQTKGSILSFPTAYRHWSTFTEPGTLNTLRKDAYYKGGPSPQASLKTC